MTQHLTEATVDQRTRRSLAEQTAAQLVEEPSSRAQVEARRFRSLRGRPARRVQQHRQRGLLAVAKHGPMFYFA